MKTELRTIPYVGKATEASLLSLGYTTIASLKGADPQELYDRECLLAGVKIDRCQLYLYRMIVYYANTPQSGPGKAKMVGLERFGLKNQLKRRLFLWMAKQEAVSPSALWWTLF